MLRALSLCAAVLGVAATAVSNANDTDQPAPPPYPDLRCTSDVPCQADGDLTARCVLSFCRCSSGFFQPVVDGRLVRRCYAGHPSRTPLEHAVIRVQFAVHTIVHVSTLALRTHAELRAAVERTLGPVQGVMVESSDGLELLGVSEVPLLEVLSRMASFPARLHEQVLNLTAWAVFAEDEAWATFAEVTVDGRCPRLVGTAHMVHDWLSGECFPTDCTPGYVRLRTACVLGSEVEPPTLLPEVVGFAVGSLAVLVCVGCLFSCLWNWRKRGDTQRTRPPVAEACEVVSSNLASGNSSCSSFSTHCVPDSVILPPSLRLKAQLDVKYAEGSDCERSSTPPLPPLELPPLLDS